MIYKMLKKIIFVLILVSIVISCDKSDPETLVVPTQLSRQAVCYIDGMILLDYPGPKAQLITKNNETHYFCDVKGFLETWFDPNNILRIKSAFVQDFSGLKWGSYKDKWIKAENAWYVFGSKLSGAMGQTVVPFSSNESALIFAKENGGKVLRFDQINQEILEQYLKQVRDSFRQEHHHNH